MKEKGEKESQYATLKGTGIDRLWLNDLAELREEYMKQEAKRVACASASTKTTASGSGTGASGKKPVKVLSSKTQKQ
jgi:hypothetical protein